MTRLFKKLDITGVAIMLLAFFVAVGFTAAEEMQPTWYEVEITDLNNPDTPANQKIGEDLESGPEGDCDKGEEIICAVLLEVAPGTPFPSNMQEASSFPGVTIHAESYRDN